MEQVFISAISLRLPGLPDEIDSTDSALSMGIHRAIEDASARLEPPTAEASVSFNPDLPQPTLPRYPSPKETKAMSDDVIASCIALGGMLARAGLTREQLTRVPLYAARGVSNAGADIDIGGVIRNYFESEKGHSVEQRNALLFGRTYPLIVLKVLANSLQSYLGQIYGPCGDSTTFGNTSVGGFHALAEAAGQIASGECEMALVGASQASDALSAATYLNFHPSITQYRESAGASFLLLRSGKNIADTGSPALCELVDWKSVPGVPTDFEEPLGKPYREFPGDSAHLEAAIFSGGISPAEYESERSALGRSGARLLSWYPRWGSLGAVSVIANVAAGAAGISAGSWSGVECLDRDPYGRESWVRLK